MRPVVLQAICLLILFAGPQKQEDWKSFTSTTGFSVMYPGTWRQIGISTDRLDILSSGEFAKGVVIARGEAEIVVRELRDSTGASLEQLIDRDNKDDSLLSRRDLREAGANNRGYVALVEVVSTSEVGPGAREIDTAFYCERRGRRFSTTLRNWMGEKRWAEYQRVALRIARSLRVTQ